jgi:uncharacterized protein YbjT (DUF2867 family)
MMILVTGATGKVGRHLVADLLAAGAEVRALTRDPAAADLPAGADDMLRYLAGYVGRTAEMSPDFTAVTRLPGTTFAEWAAGRADAFR